jgi:hypothetical protein
MNIFEEMKRNDPRRFCKWTNGKKTISGWYIYNWGSDRFVTQVNRGKRRIVYGDRPEWGNWKLVKE